jgi:hypothetical protein
MSASSSPTNHKYAGKKWTVATDTAWKFDFEKMIAHPDLEHIDWMSAVGVQKSKGGSQGVYFVETPNGAVVVKGSNSIGAEMFCFLLAEKCGIPAPKCRIVPRESNEGELIYNKLVELDDRQPIHRSARQALFRTFLMIQEYCTGSRSLASVSDEWLSNVIWKSKDKGEMIWQTIGSIAAFDMFLRNTDRFPLVVDNRGNPGNVMFDNSGRVLSIDNCSMCIDLEKQETLALQYALSVAKYVRQLFEHPDELQKDTMRLQSNIMQYTEYDIGEKGAMAAQRGIKSLIEKLDQIQVKDLVDIKKSVSDYGAQKGKDQVVGLQSVRLNFLVLMLDIFKSRGNLDVHQTIQICKNLHMDHE